MFITFEGIEGSGKSTQQEKVATWLRDEGHQVCVTKEPGGTEFGMHIRKLILDPATTFESKYTELLLFYADRLEHVEGVVKPALLAGEIVLCDRYIDSTVAYQHGGRQLDIKTIESLNSLVNFSPELTILCDIEAQKGLARAKNRAELDRFEQEDIDFHHRIRAEYLTLASQYPDRIKCVNADQAIDAVTVDIKTIIKGAIKI
jgi:dTMP kinase